MLRILATVGIFAVLSGCQTGGTDTAGALSSAAGNDGVELAAADAEQSLVVDGDGNATQPDDGSTGAEVEVEKQATNDVSQPNADPVVAGVQKIAAIRNEDGEPAAVLAVLDCYKKARDRAVPLTGARICAAQDFVVSREVISKRPATATGTGDRALLVSKRHAERIGALMKLKGMNQSQFNTFGAYLHAVAEPEYQKARKS